MKGIILCDTREQDLHILKKLDTLEIEYRRKKLDYGDYSFEIDGKSYDYEEYFKSGDSLKYCFDGDQLKYMLMTSSDGKVNKIEFLKVTSDVPDTLFDLPSDYKEATT